MGNDINKRGGTSPVPFPFPADPRHALRRIHAHLVAPRLSGEDFGLIIKAMGYDSIYDFAAEFDLPVQSVEDWRSAGMTFESAQLLRGLAKLKMDTNDAVLEFDSYTHVGLEDFFKERNLI